MHQNKTRAILVTALAALLLAAGSATAESGLFRGSQLDEMAKYYGEVNGDRSAYVTLRGFRGLTPLDHGLGGYARFDLIDGKVLIELAGVQESVDVYALDNLPAEGSSFLPEAHDRLVRLARVEQDGQLNVDLGKEAFRGFELDRVLVVSAGADPLEDQLLLIGGRSAAARRFTQMRLEREGFSVPQREAKPFIESKAIGLASSPHPIMVTKGLVAQDIFDGGEIFFREEFNGNGRSCGSCHPPENNQVIDPPFLAAVKPSCDLTNPNNTGVCGTFVAETRPSTDPISNLEKIPLLNDHGLILENLEGFRDPFEFFMMRSVPHSLSLGTSFEPPPPGTPPEGPPAPDPNFSERTGWSGDGAPNADAGIPNPPNPIPATGSFRDFITGAIMQHYPDKFFELPGRLDPSNFRFADDDELDDAEQFMKHAGRVNDIQLVTDAGVPLIDFVDNPALSPPNLIDFVLPLFDASACGVCHGNAGANGLADFDMDGDRDFLGNRLFDTGVERLPNPIRDAFPGGFPLDCGNSGGETLAACAEGETAAECGDFDVDGDGTTDCFGNGMFNVTPLIEAADTGPWFHTNTAVSLFADLSDGVQAAEVTIGPQATGGAPGQTIEDAIMFYNTAEFNNSPGGQFIASIGLGPIALDTNQVIGTGAVLRALNGAFNVAQSCHRIDAALKLAPPGFTFTSNGVKATANKLCSLANDEFVDALDVLSSPFLGPIFPGAINPMNAAIADCDEFINTTSNSKRNSLAKSALANCEAALSAISNIGWASESNASSVADPKFILGDGNLLF